MAIRWVPRSIGGKRALLLLAALAAALAAAWAAWSLSPPGGRAREGFTKGSSAEDAQTKEPTIFVSVASYRDARCLATLRSMYERAAKPERVFAGVCEQNSDDVKESCAAADFKWWTNVRRIVLPYKEAKGPTYARYLCSTLYRGETHFCQIDSHTEFAQDWDLKALADLGKAPSAKAVLTHYPHDVESRDSKEVPVLCKSSFDKQGLVTFDSATLAASSKPRPVPFTSGGFVFGPGAMLREVPYDPDLPMLFQGEELLYSARLWTSGYDFFTPTQNIVFHHYVRKEDPKYWNDVEYADVQRKTVDKVKRLLDPKAQQQQQQKTRKPEPTKKGTKDKKGTDKSTGSRTSKPPSTTKPTKEYKYGMGRVRSLKEYLEFAGIDWEAKKTSTEAKFCGEAKEAK